MSVELQDSSSHSTISAPESVTKTKQALVLLSAFLAVFLTIGLNQAYGIFQSYYVSNPSPNGVITPKQAENQALVATVGTLGAGLTWGGSVIVSPLMRRVKDWRRLTLGGSLLMSLAFLGASFSKQLSTLILTQGLLYGLGSSLLYYPIVMTAPSYFTTSRGLAMGTILSGAGIGGLTLAPITRALLAHLSVRATLRLLALVTLTLSLPTALLTPAPLYGAQHPHTLVSLTLAKRPTFILQSFGALLQSAGNFIPLTFLPSFSLTLGYTANTASLLLSLSNAINATARILTGYLADRAGRQNTLLLSVIGSCISVLGLWTPALASSSQATAKATWISFIVLYGVTAGGYNALFPTTVMEVFGPAAYASVTGFIYFVRGLGALLGSPVGGAILGEGAQAERYAGVVWYCGVLLGVCSVCCIGVRVGDSVEKGWRWRA
ncbi:MAG: hypothetical protein M1834_003162 [Cirrosporium novae-zelandiae]|nr:MAG: hypothetical protein M1834_003162 [Cirrosporium novae-zelandiae]